MAKDPSSKVFFSAYSRPKRKVTLECGGLAASRTKQSFKHECDINTIVGRYLRTGVLDFVSRYEPRYADVTGVDFQRSMELVAQARGMFSQLPAKVRAEFENDAGAFVEFVSNPDNHDALVEMGLAKAKPEPAEPAGAAPQGPDVAPGGAVAGAPAVGAGGSATPPAERPVEAVKGTVPT